MRGDNITLRRESLTRIILASLEYQEVCCGYNIIKKCGIMEKASLMSSYVKLLMNIRPLAFSFSGVLA